MTNFIYNMQDELFHLNMILPVGEFSPIKTLVDHIEAQGKQLRELNAAITKRNKTIEKYEREKEDLLKKADELKNGIHDADDLSWKQKYYALLHSSEQVIGALQKNAETDATTSTIETLVKENNKLKERRDELIKECDALYDENKELKEEVNLYIGMCNTKHEEVKALAKLVHAKDLEGKIEKLKEENKTIEKKCREEEKALEDEKQVNKNLNTIINNKNKLLDEYMTKCNNLEHNYNEELRMKEQFKTTCFKQEITIKHLKEEVFDYIRLNNVLRGKLASIGKLVNKEE